MGTKISDFLSATTPLGGTELVPIVQAGVTVKTTAAAFKTTNAADLATGTVAIARLPVSSQSSAGIVRLGTTSGLACEGNDARLSDARIPLGGAGGDLTGAYPNPALTTTGVSALTYGGSGSIGVFAVDAKGRITGATSQPIAISGSQITSGTIAATYLPAGTTAAAGVLQLGTTAGTAIQGNDPRIGGSSGFLIFDTVGANQSIPANAIPSNVKSIKVTVIAGGGGSGYGTSGGNGDSSSFSLNGITITATGGTGGGGSTGGSGGTGGSVSGVSGYVGGANGGTGASSGNAAQDGAFSVNVGIGMGGGGGGAGAGGGSGNGFGGSINYLRSISTPSGTFSANGGGASASIQGGIIGGGSGGYGVGKSGFLYGGGGGTSSTYWGGGGGGAAVFQIAITGGVLYTNAITVGAGGIAGSVNAAAGAQGVVVIEW
jgi:hypothetical protein